jgi:hypothetical protein
MGALALHGNISAISGNVSGRYCRTTSNKSSAIVCTENLNPHIMVMKSAKNRA